MSRPHDRPPGLRYDGTYAGTDGTTCRFTPGGAAIWAGQVAGWRFHQGVLRVLGRDLRCEGTIGDDTVELTQRRFVGDEGTRHALAFTAHETPDPGRGYRVVLATYAGDAPEPCTITELEAHCAWNEWPVPALRERPDGVLECAEDLIDGRGEGIMHTGEPVLEPLHM